MTQQLKIAEQMLIEGIMARFNTTIQNGFPDTVDTFNRRLIVATTPTNQNTVLNHIAGMLIGNVIAFDHVDQDVIVLVEPSSTGDCVVVTLITLYGRVYRLNTGKHITPSTTSNEVNATIVKTFVDKTYN